MIATRAELAYAAAMIALALLGLALGFTRRRELAIATPGYRAQLRAPVRLGAFVLALVVFVVVAPYTGDPTWDWVDAAFMSIGCYVTAPWAVATVLRVLRKRASAIELALAAIAWWIVASASYDVYLLARDGAFPPTSYENAVASTVLYLLGGLFFSLGVDRERGLVLVFTDARWPAWSGDEATLRSAIGVFGLAVLIAAPIVVFLVWAVMGQLGLLP